jgi:glycosyltransferase involved in cell wall biosynthesis
MSLVSVVMPAYNAERYLEKSIESILNQSLRDFEFIIIDDGSTDHTSKILDYYAARDSRIRVIHQKNSGVTDSLNTGISLASSKYIARMDADDISHPLRLYTEYEFLESNPDYVLVGTDFSIIDIHDNTLSKVRRANDDTGLRALMHLNSPFAHGSVMFRNDAFNKAGGYRRESGSAEDYDLWYRMQQIGSIYVIPKILFNWRLGDNNITTVHSEKVMVSAAKIRDEINSHLPLLLSLSTLKKEKQRYSEVRFLDLLDNYTRICMYQIKKRQPVGFKNLFVITQLGSEGRRAALNRVVQVITGGKRRIDRA